MTRPEDIASDMSSTLKDWQEAGNGIAPVRDTVHILRADLVRDDIASARALLSPDEQARADRFVFEKDQRRFIVARAALRELLAACLDTDPTHIQFQYGEHGKPELFLPATDLTFNLSHAGDIALYALARNRRIGIDVEALDAGKEPDRVAARFFTQGEREALQGKSGPSRQAAFVTFWTRKEAYLKACGKGLFASPESFETTLEQPPRILSVGGDSGAGAAWTLLDFIPRGDYAAALVAEGNVEQVAFYEWRPVGR